LRVIGHIIFVKNLAAVIRYIHYGIGIGIGDGWHGARQEERPFRQPRKPCARYRTGSVFRVKRMAEETGVGIDLINREGSGGTLVHSVKKRRQKGSVFHGERTGLVNSGIAKIA